MSNYSEYKRKQLEKQTMSKYERQEIFENILVSIIIIFLSAHLFTVHSKLLFHINPDKLVKELVYKFNGTLFNQELITSTIGAIAYSLITALILTIFVKFRKVFIFSVCSFALLDGVGVFVYYNVTAREKAFIITGAIYYAIYTAIIIISLGLFRHLKYSNVDTLYNKIDESIKENDITELRDMMQVIFKENIHNIQNIQKEEKDIDNIQEKHTISPEIFDEKVFYLSKEMKKTQVEIADELGISQPQVSRILSKFKRENV